MVEPILNQIYRRFACGLVIVALLAVSPAHAQTPSPVTQAKTVFDYKQELNLTDRQEQDIRAILEDLNKEVKITRAKLTLIDIEVGDLIKSEGDLEVIRKRLREAAELQVALRVADLVATRRINKTFSTEQLKRWRAIQAAAMSKPQK